jgi:hypothetical protein
MCISYKRKMIHQNLESSCEKQLSPGGAPLFWRVLFVVGRNTFLQYGVSVQAVSFEAPHCMATSAPGSANHALFWLTLQLMVVETKKCS